MKRKGFTLIELLAVIVVLAIIALIATPIVMNTIKSAKKGAAERSADSYIGAVETAVATKRLDEIILEGEYIIQPDGNLCPTSGCGENDKDKVIIEMEGNKPTSGTITIKDGQVRNDSTMTIGDYDVKYNEDNKKYEAAENVPLEVLCTKKDGVDLANLVYGNEFTCELGDGVSRTFYLLEDGDTTTLTDGRLAQAKQVSLIMNANIGANGEMITASSTDKETVAWSGGSTSDVVKATKVLLERTAAWTKLKQDKITLPTAYQIAQAGQDTYWTVDKSVGSKLPLWLHENLDAEVYLYGYWTSTPCASGPAAFTVSRSDSFGEYRDDMSNAGLGGDYYTRDNMYGTRPVITISKSQLG